MIYEEKEVTNKDLLNYFAERTKMLEGLVEKMSAELVQLRQEVKYNNLIAKTASPIFPEEERKTAALEVLKINEANKNRQLDPNGGFDNATITR